MATATISFLPSPSSSSLCCLRGRRPSSCSVPSSLHLRRILSCSRPLRRSTVVFPLRALAGEETLESEAAVASEDEVPPTPASADTPVSVPVSPSDMLTMFFKAEGTMDESAVTAVRKAFQGMEGVNELKVQIVEGIGSVELRKETTVQATGVASNLVEVIQGSGFKLQTLNLSFEDEEDAIN